MQLVKAAYAKSKLNNGDLFLYIDPAYGNCVACLKMSKKEVGILFVGRVVGTEKLIAVTADDKVIIPNESK